MSKSLTSIIKSIVADSFVLKLYYKVFKPFYYQASLDYKLTDETHKFVHILEAINYSRVAHLPPVYFEFGCHSGRTFSAAVRAAKYLKMKDMEFYAFDSFEGLPETVTTVDGYFVKGTYATPIDDFKSKVRKLSGLDIEDKYLIKGFYSESLTEDLQNKMHYWNFVKRILVLR